jgi:sulfate adenylyltransferase subunit 1 (EFTu-like GTPase family)
MAHAPMSVTLVLDHEIDISRGDTITTAHGSGVKAQGAPGDDFASVLTPAPYGVDGQPYVGRRFEADVVWMDERPLDPARLYMLKHTTRTVTVEANRPLALNQIETVTLATSRPLVFDRYRDIRATGSFILIDPSTNFTAGAGMIIDAIRDDHAAQYRPNAAERLVKIARSAPSHEAAVAAMQRAIEELLK